MDIEKLATQADRVITYIRSMSYEDRRTHGMEYRRGWFNIFNEEAGQTRIVLYHPQSGFIFKRHSWSEPDGNSSRRVLGTVVLDDKKYTVRLPEYHVIGDIQVAECVPVVTCCPSQHGWCHHSEALGAIDNDSHAGNYRIVGDEIILIDFECIDIDD